MEEKRLDIEFLKKRWHQKDGQEMLGSILAQRFFLKTMKDKQDAFANQDLITDLRGIDLSCRVLHDFVLYGADIRWGNFENSTLIGPAQDVNLSSSTFTGATTKDGHFWNAQLVNCKFDKSNIKNTLFEDADARLALFKDATFDEVDFYETDLRGANFDGAIFKKCSFCKVKLDAKMRSKWEQYNAEECSLKVIDWCDDDLPIS